MITKPYHNIRVPQPLHYRESCFIIVSLIAMNSVFNTGVFVVVLHTYTRYAWPIINQATRLSMYGDGWSWVVTDGVTFFGTTKPTLTSIVGSNNTNLVENESDTESDANVNSNERGASQSVIYFIKIFSMVIIV